MSGRSTRTALASQWARHGHGGFVGRARNRLFNAYVSPRAVQPEIHVSDRNDSALGPRRIRRTWRRSAGPPFAVAAEALGPACKRTAGTGRRLRRWHWRRTRRITVADGGNAAEKTRNPGAAGRRTRGCHRSLVASA